MNETDRREAIKRLQVILDHFTDQTEREVFQGWNMDAKGRHVATKRMEASPSSFWHDSAVHEAMNGNDPSCEVINCARWVMTKLQEIDEPGEG